MQERNKLPDPRNIAMLHTCVAPVRIELTHPFRYTILSRTRLPDSAKGPEGIRPYLLYFNIIFLIVVMLTPSFFAT